MRGVKGCIAVLVILVSCGFNAALAADWDPLPDTGQTDCYDVEGNVIVCPAEGEALYGQDGNYAGPTPYWQGNGDGTVTDMHTNLMWQQGTGPWSTWQGMQDYCSNLTLAGYEDWRLPERMELKSILDYSRTYPTCDPIFQAKNPSPTYQHRYASVTTYAANTGAAWAVNFDHGSDYTYTKTSTSDYSQVRCVRGGL